MPGIYDDIFKQQGFTKIGSLCYRLQLDIWWDTKNKIQIIHFILGSRSLLKGSKSYYLKSISEEGETWARDIGPLHDYLEAHFQEVHLAFSYFRGISDGLAAEQVHRKRSAELTNPQIPSVEEMSKLQRYLLQQRSISESSGNLLSLDDGSSELLHSYLKQQTRSSRTQLRQLKQEHDQKKNQVSLYENMLNEYKRKGSAATLVFGLHSNTHMTQSPQECADAVSYIVKELNNAHRYQVWQKLNGGRLNIYVEEAKEPVWMWLEEWLGGALSPCQLARFAREFKSLQDMAIQHTMVTANKNIMVDGHIRDDQKLLAARVVSTMLKRLDRTKDAAVPLKDLPAEMLPIRLGLLAVAGKITEQYGVLPAGRFDHLYVSGTTGSGKSFTGRVIVEEAAQYEHLNILILDPRNQSVGLLVPEDRDSVLSSYPDFEMEPAQAKGFSFNYFSPGQDLGEELPDDLSELSQGRSIVSFKGLNDHQRCSHFADILESVLESLSTGESEILRLLVVVEEAHQFTKQRTGIDAKQAAQRAENALDRFLREARKYGGCAMTISQSNKDFSRDSASVRQNTNTKVFMHNSDREVDYASSFIGDGRQITRLKPGMAIVFNPLWGAVTLKVRPPLSKVWDFSLRETRKIVRPGPISRPTLSPEGMRLLGLIKAHTAGNHEAMNMSDLAASSGISSKRWLNQLVEELEGSGYVRTRKLRKPGQPRIVEPISSGGADEMLDQSRTETGQEGQKETNR
ncbi:MAG: helicase HerA domain-containing protein [Planctomycetota bacterium]